MLSKDSSTHANRRGAAFLSTMFIVVFLSSLVLVFARQMQSAAAIVHRQSSEAQARWIVDGVIQAIIADLQASIDTGSVPALDFVESDAGQLGLGLYWILFNDPSENDAFSEQTFGVLPMCSRVNLNGPQAQVGTRLARLPRMDQDLVSVFQDWRDGDDTAGQSRGQPLDGNGAESDYYLSRPDPYPAKNGDLDTVQELLLLRGFEPSVVYGEDTNRNGLLDDNENDGTATAPDDDANGRLDRGLLDYVAIYGREPNTTVTGTERINLNEDNLPDLRRDLARYLVGALGQEVGEALVVQILTERGNDGDYASVLDLKRRLDRDLSDEDYKTIEPGLTTRNGDAIEGLIDVLTAPEEVIYAVIGNEDDARRIVDARPQDASDRSLLWLLSAVDEELAVTYANQFTTRSFQFSADIVAISGDGRAFIRRRVVFDTLSDNGQEIDGPRVVSLDDLTHHGWPLNPEIREQLRDGVDPEEVAATFASRIR